MTTTTTMPLTSIPNVATSTNPSIASLAREAWKARQPELEASRSAPYTTTRNTMPTSQNTVATGGTLNPALVALHGSKGREADAKLAAALDMKSKLSPNRGTSAEWRAIREQGKAGAALIGCKDVAELAQAEYAADPALQAEHHTARSVFSLAGVALQIRIRRGILGLDR